MTIIGSEIDKPTGGFVENSFIEFDCDGFKSFTFKSDIRISRSLVIPVDAEGKRIEYDNDLATDGYKTTSKSLSKLA